MSAMFLLGCQKALLSEIADNAMTQPDIARTYALAVRSVAAKADTVDWGVVNRAILERWSMAGLERIKKLAWKEARQQP